jgi:hypothetical protein
MNIISVQGGADKSSARPGRKHATATKLEIYSTYSPLSTIHFLGRCSNFCKPLKSNSECCSSNQVSAAAMTSVSDENWRSYNCRCLFQILRKNNKVVKVSHVSRDITNVCSLCDLHTSS